MISIQPITPYIGARVSGFDPAGEIGRAEAEMLVQALERHHVIFLNAAAPLSLEAFKRLGRVFGPLETHEGLQNAVLSKDQDGSDDSVQAVKNDGGRPRGTFADQWHSDSTHMERPVYATLGMPTLLPPLGGDTAFLSMHAAYDALPLPLQRLCDELEAVHAPQTDPFNTPGRVHPVVRIHPRTGRKALYVNVPYTKHIVGMTPGQSRRLLDLLLEHCTLPDFQMRHRWTAGDIAVWDNTCTMHYATVDYTQPRILHRLCIKGEKPVGPLDLMRRAAAEGAPEAAIQTSPQPTPQESVHARS